MEENTSRSEDDTGEEQEDSNSASAVANLPSSTRHMRNQAEKLRRDKLTGFINELAVLVPMVASSAKRLDKTSILRLSATFIRMNKILVRGRDVKAIPQLPMAMNWCQYMLEGMEGMLLVVTSSGKIVFISHTVETILGHQQIEMLGQSLFNITNLEDHEELKRNLKPDEELPELEESSRRAGTSRGDRGPPQRRSFYLRLRQRAVSRSDQPQYELVHIVGHLRIPKTTHDSSSSQRTEPPLSNDVVLVALVKPFREKRITEFSLLEATKEEWITRHLVDGRIVFTDHRISVVSGYLSEEVTGIHAFRYMHKDDVRWVMIALRQMYYRGESYGSSCYRLQAKTGEFIYIRTHGYLELGEDSNSVQSFICINTLVSKEEGEKYITQMKALYTPLVADKSEPGISALAENHIVMNGKIQTEDEEMIRPPTVEDPKELDEAIEQMLSNLPVQNIPQRSPSPLPDQQYVKVAMLSKTMPPVTVHTSKVGIPVPSLRRNSSASKFDRPSVLRVTQSNTNTVSVVPVEGCKPTSVVVKPDKQKRTSDESESVVKRLRPEESSVIVSEVSRGGVIRHRQDYSELRVDVEEHLLPSTTSMSLGTVGVSFLEPTSDTDTRNQDDFIFPNDLPFPNLTEALEDHLQVPVDTIAMWDNEVGELEEGVVRGQLQLEDRMQFQERQFSAIEDDLTSVPIATVGGHIYRSTFTHLKAEHRKQQQMLRTLQQDHQNIQHCNKEQLSMRGAHQDIGV